jgi:hypothetical protein
MRIFVNHKEENSYFIEHQNDSIFDPDLLDLENFISELDNRFSKPQCCYQCIDEVDDGIERGDCPCRTASSLL